MTGPRVIAIDWSGALQGERRRIWLAEVRAGELIRLESGRSRAEVAQHLIEEASRDPETVVGIDFAFSFPEWFLHATGAQSAAEVWALAEEQGETWLTSGEPPFWGRGGQPRPDLPDHFRRTEKMVGGQPSSVFKIGGAGAVGTGSIRGMPVLTQLKRAGISIWPFDSPKFPLLVEIYPRLLTGNVRRSDPTRRREYLSQRYPTLSERWVEAAGDSEDAFDAAVSALVMDAHSESFASLPPAGDQQELLEGRIWHPEPALAPEARASATAKVARPRPGREGRGAEGASSAAHECVFCNVAPDQVVADDRHSLAFLDGFPVAAGHTLVVPKRHVESIFDLPQKELASLWRLVGKVREQLKAQLRADAFTVGINDGSAAGQTVGHAHVHVIPRRQGDVEDPRGGIRCVIPERAAYWSGSE